MSDQQKPLAIREKRPSISGWREMPVPESLAKDPNVLSISAWCRGNVFVFSALSVSEYPDSGEPGPQWHVSISRFGKRPRDFKDIRGALRAFDMTDGEEDNHHPGVARQFWKPVDPEHRVEEDGYTWTNPKDGPCRGCEYELTFGRPCPLHNVMFRKYIAQ